MNKCVTVEIQDITIDNKPGHTWVFSFDNLTCPVSELCYTSSIPHADVKRTYRTNVVFRGEDGKFMSWKKLGKMADLSDVAPFPPKC